MNVPDFAPDLTCSVCAETCWVTGETLEKRTAALEAWPGCCEEGSS